MTTTTTTPSEPIGLSHIDCFPVWDKEEIVVFDMYTKEGVWLGSRRLLRYCEQFDIEFPNIDIKKYRKKYIINASEA